MSKKLIAVTVSLLSASALAQESEFKAKMKEDLEGYASQIESNCGIKPKLVWSGGKLGHNPRESEKPEFNSLSTLCTSALDAVSQACSNEVVKSKLSKVATIECTKGKGTIGYKLKATTLTLSVDASFVKNNAAGQTSDLEPVNENETAWFNI